MVWFEHRQPRVLEFGRKELTRASHAGRTFLLQRSEHGNCDKREGEQIVTNVREIAQGGADSNDRAVGRPDTVLRTQNTREKTNPAHPEGRTGFERELIGGETAIRTLGELPHTRVPGVPIQPLLHLSV